MSDIVQNIRCHFIKFMSLSDFAENNDQIDYKTAVSARYLHLCLTRHNIILRHIKRGN